LALLRTRAKLDAPDITLRLGESFNTMTISIVRGQVLDLEHEGGAEVAPDDYLTMIHDKTAAIVRFAAWAGAIIGGASDATARQFADVGDALGMGFQLRDDMLGIWSPVEETGKDEADDIRRRKQSHPILMLRHRASEADTERLNTLFAQEEIEPAGVDEVLAMLERYHIKRDMRERVEDAHTRAMTALHTAIGDTRNPAVDELTRLITRHGTRTS